MPVQATRSMTISTASGTAISTATGWVPLCIHSTPFNVSFGVSRTGGGSVAYSVQHTFDNVLDANVSAIAFVHADVSVKSAAQIDGNYAYPVRAIRLITVSASGSATLALRVIQSDV